MAKEPESTPPTRGDAVRAAAAQALEAAGHAGLSRERAQELAEELSHAAARVREAIDELRPPTAEEFRSLRAEVQRLEERVRALEAERQGATTPTGSAAEGSGTANLPRRSPP